MFSNNLLNKKITLAVTGSIGSGKSLAVEVIEECGYPVSSADKAGHEALQDKQIKSRITTQFGEAVLTNNEIDRKTLGQIVFADKEKLALLNKIVHPFIIETIAASVKQFKEGEIFPDSPLLFWEVPLLFEAGIRDMFDISVNIHCPRELRRQRIIERDKISPEQAAQRMDTQLNDEEKISQADINISNACGKECFKTKVREMLSLVGCFYS